MHAIASSAISRLIAVGGKAGDRFQPQNMSNTAWACARLKFKHVPLMKALSAASINSCAQFKPTELANTAWSFAKVEFLDRTFLTAISSSAQARISSFKVQDVSNTAWSFARLNVQDSQLMDALAARSMSLMHQFVQQDIANTAWALATLRMPNQPLCAALAEQAVLKCPQFATQHLSNTSWAFAHLSFIDGPLMDSIAAEAIPRIHQFAFLELANTAWAFAEVRVMHEPLMAAISASASVRSDGDIQGVAALIDAGVGTYRHAEENGNFASGGLEARLSTTVIELAESLPRSYEDWQSAELGVLLAARADNVGACGTSQLLDIWKIEEADSEFVGQAWAVAGEVATADGGGDRSSAGGGSFPEGAWAYMEFDLRCTSAVDIQEIGSAKAANKLNGNRFAGPTDMAGGLPASAAEAWWDNDNGTSALRAFPLGVRSAVVRDACAEFRLLSKFAAEVVQLAHFDTQVGSSGGSRDGNVTGRVCLFASWTPCLSCLAAMRQFQLRFPCVHLSFAGGRHAAASAKSATRAVGRPKE
mmetsp:Transcript_71882/g.181684  ORF Transcript_71882/g.181684 Transcript_71882/m.181684 type:complete len:533 (+) Transcript_71882:108-1706(+)